MPNKPTSLTLASLIYLFIGLSIPIQIILIDSHHILEWPIILNKITILNWVIFFSCILSAYYISKASSVLKYFLPLLFCLVSVNNFYVSEYSNYIHFAIPHISSFLFLILTLTVQNGQLKELIDVPSKRWWLIPKRYQKNVPIVLKIDKSHHIFTKCFDISESGSYISFKENQRDKLSSLLNIGELIEVNLEITKNISISCKAKIIRKSCAKGHYPAGFGLQFIGLGRLNKLKLLKALHIGPFSFLNNFN